MSNLADELERWLPVVGYEGLYEVSDRGRVRSMRLVPPLVMSLGWAKRGQYPRIVLRRGGDRQSLYVHRMVLEAFAGPAPDGHEASHLDGDMLNASATNLAWETKRVNHARKAEHGTRQIGRRNGQAKLSREAALQIVRERASGRKQCDIARDLGVSPSAIEDVLHGRRWSWATGIGRASNVGA